MSAPLLETRGLTMRFGGVTAVDGVDFSLRPGELRCLIGPNGAGKSTFFKMLTGQLRPSAGDVRLRGESIAGARPHEIARRGVGIKTQVPSVFDGSSVRENLWIAARRGRRPAEADDRAEAVLAQLRLTGLAGKQVGTLSHGERQQVEIGAVLAADPELILLDEPAAGMTDAEVEHTAALIEEIAGTHALVVVEHDMQFIRMIARTVTVLHQGGVLVEGDVEAVLADERVRDVYLGRGLAA